MKPTISEKLLKKWRREALNSINVGGSNSPHSIKDERIIRMTQELMDMHLMAKAEESNTAN